MLTPLARRAPVHHRDRLRHGRVIVDERLCGGTSERRSKKIVVRPLQAYDDGSVGIVAFLQQLAGNHETYDVDHAGGDIADARFTIVEPRDKLFVIILVRRNRQHELIGDRIC